MKLELTADVDECRVTIRLAGWTVWAETYPAWSGHPAGVPDEQKIQWAVDNFANRLATLLEDGITYSR